MDADTLLALGLFAQHFLVGVLLTVAFIALYALATPHKEIRLIREGNSAAAIGLVGAVFGFVLPLNLVFAVTSDLVIAVGWGIVALIAQILAHLGACLAMPGLSKDIAAGKISAGIVQAAVGVVTGMISTAALTP